MPIVNDILQVERVKSTQWRLKQERYLTEPEAASKSPSSPYDYKWDVPITWVTSSDTSASATNQIWLGQRDPFILVDAPSGTEWVKFNVGQFGYYRVNYPTEEWLKFGQILESSPETLSTKDR